MIDPVLVVSILERPSHRNDGKKKKKTLDCGKNCPWFRSIHGALLCGENQDFYWLIDKGDKLPCKRLYHYIAAGKDHQIRPAIYYLDSVISSPIRKGYQHAAA